jgi:hypothetical protein
MAPLSGRKTLQKLSSSGSIQQIDSVTSLSIVVLLVKEGREAWRGKESKTTE